MYAGYFLTAAFAFMSTVTAVPVRTLKGRQSTNSTGSQGAGRPNPTYTDEFFASLVTARGTVDRLSKLAALGSGDEYFKFDFNIAANPDPVAGVGLGGQGDLAYVSNFPALIDLGVSMSVGFMNPCGMNTPHTHNRASEFLMIVEGSNVSTSFIQESGLTTPITTTLAKYQAAILPMGSLHYEFNDNCEPAVFVAAFSNEDPGLARAAEDFFIQAQNDPDIVYADLGFPKFLDHTNLAEFEATIPKPFALGAKECLQRCGINYTGSASSPAR